MMVEVVLDENKTKEDKEKVDAVLEALRVLSEATEQLQFGRSGVRWHQFSKVLNGLLDGNGRVVRQMVGQWLGCEAPQGKRSKTTAGTAAMRVKAGLTLQSLVQPRRRVMVAWWLARRLGARDEGAKRIAPWPSAFRVSMWRENALRRFMGPEMRTDRAVRTRWLRALLVKRRTFERQMWASLPIWRALERPSSLRTKK
jgi:hypothetical protein